MNFYSFSLFMVLIVQNIFFYGRWRHVCLITNEIMSSVACVFSCLRYRHFLKLNQLSWSVGHVLILSSPLVLQNFTTARKRMLPLFRAVVKC